MRFSLLSYFSVTNKTNMVMYPETKQNSSEKHSNFTISHLNLRSEDYHEKLDTSTIACSKFCVNRLKLLSFPGYELLHNLWFKSGVCTHFRESISFARRCILEQQERHFA